MAMTDSQKRAFVLKMASARAAAAKRKGNPKRKTRKASAKRKGRKGNPVTHIVKVGTDKRMSPSEAFVRVVKPGTKGKKSADTRRKTPTRPNKLGAAAAKSIRKAVRTGNPRKGRKSRRSRNPSTAMVPTGGGTLSFKGTPIVPVLGIVGAGLAGAGAGFALSKIIETQIADRWNLGNPAEAGLYGTLAVITGVGGTILSKTKLAGKAGTYVFGAAIGVSVLLLYRALDTAGVIDKIRDLVDGDAAAPADDGTDEPVGTADGAEPEAPVEGRRWRNPTLQMNGMIQPGGIPTSNMRGIIQSGGLPSNMRGTIVPRLQAN